LGVALRVRLRLRVRGREGFVDTSALVNTGFETEAPQLLLPLRLASVLGLWPPPLEAQLLEFGTAGGPVKNYVVPNSLEVWVLGGDRVVGPVVSDAVISNVELEALINDKLAGALGIVILNPATGEWRFRDDDASVIRRTEPPQYWL
jgi:hypothetical protein